MASLRYPVKISKTKIFALSLPIFFSNLSTPLVGIVDTALMGHLDDMAYLAAISIAASVITMMFWSFGFLRMGSVGLVSQLLGKGDYREIVNTIIRYIFISIVLAVTLIVLKDYLIKIIFIFYDLSDYTKSLVEKYISIRILAAPAELLIYVMIGFYLGLQKTLISSLLVTFFNILNIILSYYFVIHLNLKVSGVAYGTLFSAYTAVGIFLVFTYFYVIKKFKVIPRLNNIFVFKKILRLFNINFNIFLRTVLLTFSFLWLNYQSSTLGENFLAINLILLQFIIIASFFLDAYAFATEGIIGFTIGRKVKKSFLLAVKNTFEISFYTSLLISTIYLLFSKLIINQITDLEFIRFLSYEYIFWIIVIPPIASFCYQFDGVFIGATHTKEMRNAMILSVLIYIIVSIYLIKILDNHGLWLSLLIFMILRSLTLNLYFSRILKKL